MIGIYKITNKNNGKVYIGQSDDIERRFREHKQKRRVSIDDYINVLGVENFTFEVLEECKREELSEKEKYYVKKYDSKVNGYNLQDGGYNNSQGEGNGRARLTEADVIFIRQKYAEHARPSKIYEQYFKGKVTKHQFQTVWQGRCWSTIMPEVYTEENKRYYVYEQVKTKALLTKEEVLNYRRYYVDHSYEETYQKLLNDKGEILKKNTFRKILTGDVRENSSYSEVPVYKKTKKCWLLNGKPVSTISESGE